MPTTAYGLKRLISVKFNKNDMVNFFDKIFLVKIRADKRLHLSLIAIDYRPSPMYPLLDN